VVNLSPATAENLGLNPFTTGVVVEKVQGLAARLGFQAGDLVLSVNGKTITNTANLADALAGASSWRVVIDRDGQKIVAEF
jgi:S1-C subfamily serine protease